MDDSVAANPNPKSVSETPEKPEVRIQMKRPRPRMEIHIPHFSIEDMPRLAETAIEVSALTTENSYKNKKYIYELIYKPVCYKILAAQGLGRHMGRWAYSIRLDFFYGDSLKKFKETILRIIRHWENFYSCLSRSKSANENATTTAPKKSNGCHVARTCHLSCRP